MPTNFPNALDAYTFRAYRSPISYENWNNVQDAVEALQAKVGVDDSANADSLDYRVGDLLIPSAPSIDPDDYQYKMAHMRLGIRRYSTNRAYVIAPLTTSATQDFGPYSNGGGDTRFNVSGNILTIKDYYIPNTAHDVFMAFVYRAGTIYGGSALEYFMAVDIVGQVNGSKNIVLTFGEDGTALPDNLVKSVCAVTDGEIQFSIIYSYT